MIFFEKQGFNVFPSRSLQDNKSAVRLEENGMVSISKRTRHIHIRYYFVIDQTKMKKVSVEHCQTKSTVADSSQNLYKVQLYMNSKNPSMGCTD
jgi:hypothetical protein